MIEIVRETKETRIKLKLSLSPSYLIDTEIPFFNHVLEALAKHSGLGIEVIARGDLDVDFHHTVEDVGIVLGQAFAQLVYPVGNIERFASADIVMDETLINCSLDISNRPYLHFGIKNMNGKVGDFDVELAEEFFRAFTFNSKITLHITKVRGKNKHHIIEASFKALAVAIRRALQPNNLGVLLSTKGII